MSLGVPAAPTGDTSQDQPPRYAQPPAPRGDGPGGSCGGARAGESAAVGLDSVRLRGMQRRTTPARCRPAVSGV